MQGSKPFSESGSEVGQCTLRDLWQRLPPWTADVGRPPGLEASVTRPAEWDVVTLCALRKSITARGKTHQSWVWGEGTWPSDQDGLAAWVFLSGTPNDPKWDVSTHRNGPSFWVRAPVARLSMVSLRNSIRSLNLRWCAKQIGLFRAMLWSCSDMTFDLQLLALRRLWLETGWEAWHICGGGLIASGVSDWFGSWRIFWDPSHR